MKSTLVFRIRISSLKNLFTLPASIILAEGLPKLHFRRLGVPEPACQDAVSEDSRPHRSVLKSENVQVFDRLEGPWEQVWAELLF